jgi:hypothetical protein
MPWVRRIPVLVLPSILGLIGCGSAHYVSQDAKSGIIAIPYNTNTWPSYYHDEAEKMMKAKCPSGYVIDMEGPVLIGSAATEAASRTTDKTNVMSQPNWALQHPPAVEETEWQIKFHAKEVVSPSTIDADRNKNSVKSDSVVSSH